MSKHVPVLLREVIEDLNPQPGEFFIDGTLGGGGHTRAIAERIGNLGKMLCIDWDQNAVLNFKKPDGRDVPEMVVKNANYRDIPEILKDEHLPKADGMILDLGFSSDQIEDAERGFSFQYDGPLDMRYSGEYQSAADIVNQYREHELETLFHAFGGERYAGRIAKALCEVRKRKKFETTKELEDVIFHAVPAFTRKGKIHPATRVFQALRIAVNHELENVALILKTISECVKSGGRVAIITFHSLEDKIVKEGFKDLVSNGKAEFIHKKPISPQRDEIKNNPRSRSAKIRSIKIL
ncbi:MAG: 16S rRNA (cytosine(1402)-N(4))-methyltransferase RsmH [Candidatus Paceibacterota bacterium]|jgi:16S rRNA (cytosine1402-N4)-methyltransferase